MKQTWIASLAALLAGALTLDTVEAIAAAAEETARVNDWKVAMAIVDEGGYLLYFQRHESVQIGAVEAAIRKATSAAKFKRPGKTFADRVAGEPQVMMIPGSFPFEGGLPLAVGDQVVGAIGVSGVQSRQDAQIGKAGQDASARIAAR